MVLQGLQLFWFWKTANIVFKIVFKLRFCKNTCIIVPANCTNIQHVDLSIAICFPSIALTQLGKFHSVSNSLARHSNSSTVFGYFDITVMKCIPNSQTGFRNNVTNSSSINSEIEGLGLLRVPSCKVSQGYD